MSIKPLVEPRFVCTCVGRWSSTASSWVSVGGGWYLEEPPFVQPADPVMGVGVWVSVGGGWYLLELQPLVQPADAVPLGLQLLRQRLQLQLVEPA